MLRNVEKFLKESIEPSLKIHGGGVELVDIDNDVVFIKLIGGCVGCAMSQQTLTLGIKKQVMNNFKEIKDVIDITDHSNAKNPYFKK